MLVNGQLNGREIRMAIDTGASGSYVNSRILNRDDGSLLASDSADTLTADGSSTLPTLGVLKTRVTVMEKSEMVELIVANRLAFDMILGLDLTRVNAMLTYQ
jgi:hypothetical protein